jgi:hypothetical protein
MINQITQHVEGLTSQAYLLVASPKLRVREIKAEGREKTVWLAAQGAFYKDQVKIMQLSQINQN